MLLLLALAAGALAGLNAVTGVTDVVLYGGPLLLVLGMLLSGRFVGEAWILARRRPRRRPRRAEFRRHWPRLRDRALASLLERSPRLLRGPPAPAAA